MMRWTWLCFASLLPVACVVGGGSKAPEVPPPPAVEGQDPASPPSQVVRERIRNITQTYREYCANCHGDRGQGGGAGTKTLLTAELYDQKYDKPFFDAIKNGVDHMGMEAFGDTLDDASIWGLVVHIRELQARALREKNGSPKPVNGVYRSKHHSFRLETVVDEDQGLNVPWGIDWLPDRRMLVTNRPGGVMLFANGKLTPIAGIPETREIGQGGMMEVAVHPNYRQNGWIYLAYAEPAKEGPGAQTKIVRGKLTFPGGTPTWTGAQTVFEAPADSYTRAGVHFGSRIVFDKGKIYFAIGDRGQQDRAQDVTRPNGKVYRLNDDGTIPKDNPFVGKGGVADAVWSYGHRNPQGLVMDLNGNLWDTEHGPRGGDEVNRVVKGANYGWPVVAFSTNYNDSPFATPWPAPEQKITQPVFRWLPSIGACGLDVARGPAFPKWRGDLLAGGLAGQNVDRLRIQGDKIVEREELIHGIARVREVAVGPDGFVYIAFNDPDKIVRMVPVP